MSCTKTHKLKGVQHIGEYSPAEMMVANLCMWYDWAFLCIGSFYNVEDPDTFGSYNLAQLEPTYFPGYADGQVWQGFRENWVKDGPVYTDISNAEHNYISNQVYVAGNPVSNYEVDYDNGLIIFDSAQSTTADITADYSYKLFTFRCADQIKWWSELQKSDWLTAEKFFDKQDCGIWTVNSNHRLQLPLVVFQLIGGGSEIPIGYGSCCMRREEVVFIQIFAETQCERDRIMDIMNRQNNKCLEMFDLNTARLNDDYCGQIQKTFPELVEDYPWTTSRISDTAKTGFNQIGCGLYHGTLRQRIRFCSC